MFDKVRKNFGYCCMLLPMQGKEVDYAEFNKMIDAFLDNDFNYFVPAPWWKTDYFEVRYENIEENKRYFYPLDGEGIRYEIVSFSRAIDSDKNTSYISESVSVAIAKIMEQFYSGDVILIK